MQVHIRQAVEALLKSDTSISDEDQLGPRCGLRRVALIWHGILSFDLKPDSFSQCKNGTPETVWMQVIGAANPAVTGTARCSPGRGWFR